MGNGLVSFGFSWMVVAAIIGLLLARRHELTLASLEEVAGKGDLADYHRVSDGYKWNKTVHAHAFLFSLVAVAIGLAMPRMNLPEWLLSSLTVVPMVSAVLWTAGAPSRNRPLMVIGDLSLLASIAVSAVGMLRASL